MVTRAGYSNFAYQCEACFESRKAPQVLALSIALALILVLKPERSAVFRKVDIIPFYESDPP